MPMYVFPSFRRHSASDLADSLLGQVSIAGSASRQVSMDEEEAPGRDEEVDAASSSGDEMLKLMLVEDSAESESDVETGPSGLVPESLLRSEEDARYSEDAMTAHDRAEEIAKRLRGPKRDEEFSSLTQQDQDQFFNGYSVDAYWFLMTTAGMR